MHEHQTPLDATALLHREGVDTDRRSQRLLLVAALRAWALVATAAGACLADHGSILPGSSFGRLRGGGRRDRLASVAAAVAAPAFAPFLHSDSGDHQGRRRVHPP